MPYVFSDPNKSSKFLLVIVHPIELLVEDRLEKHEEEKSSDVRCAPRKPLCGSAPSEPLTRQMVDYKAGGLQHQYVST